MAVNTGMGTVLKATISGILTAIAQVVEVDGPEATQETKSTVNLSSTVKTFRTLIPDGGTVTARVQYDPAGPTHQFLATAINTWPQTPAVWNIVFNDAGSGVCSFSALVTKFKPTGMNEEDNLEAELEIKITGPITWPTS